MRAMNRLLVFIFCSMIVSLAIAAPPVDEPRLQPARGEAGLDEDTYIQANRILGFVTNYGSLFTDDATVLGRTNGFYYPFTSISDIQTGVNDNTVVWAAGLWLGGKVGGNIRVTVAAYGAEYSPGQYDMIDDPLYRVYRLYSDSLASNPNSDYLNWPVSQGAPTTEGSTPAMLGDQMLWSVFNDGVDWAHTNNAGSTLPLGVEVRMTTWATSSPSSTEGDAVFVKYLLYNKGGNQIDSFYIAFWADPDLGGPSDDLVGCDTLNNIFFCYNSDNDDIQYGTTPPAWGGRLVSGPVVPSAGDTAMFDGNPLPNYRNLSMTSFSKYINGTDPQTHIQSYNYMKGRLPDGSPLPDGTKFMVPGDPVTGSGDVDTNPADRRLMASFGPITFMPGDSQQIVFKFGAQFGHDRLSAITNLKSALLVESPVSHTCDSAAIEVFDQGALLDVYLDPAEPAWLKGYDWGRLFFNGGVTLGENFFGSQMTLANYPDSFSTVEVQFSKTYTQKAYRYLYPTYEYAGYYDVPFTVWDTDRHRKLNAAFVEIPGSPTCDSTWGPGDSTGYAGREYLVIFRSTYSDGDPSSAAIPYETLNLKADANQIDALYAGWFMVADGHSIDELDEPQKLVFRAQSRNQNGSANTLLLPVTRPGLSSYQPILVNVFSSGFGQVDVQFLGNSQLTLSPYSLQIDSANPAQIVSVREIANGSGPVDPPLGRDVMGILNSTGDWMLGNTSYADFNRQRHLAWHDYEIRFIGSSYCYDYNRRDVMPNPVPFEVWDIGFDTPDFSGDDRRLRISLIDWDLSGTFTWEDRIYVLEDTYVEPLPDTYEMFTESLTRVLLSPADGTNLSLPAPGTVIRFVVSKNHPAPAQSIVDPPTTTGPIDPVQVRLDAASSARRDLVLPYIVHFTPAVDGTASGSVEVRDSATAAVLATMNVMASTPGACCAGPVGNIDCDPTGSVDVSDLGILIEHLFTWFTPLCCEAEAQCDNQPGIDIGDLTALIDNLYIKFTPLPACQ